MDSISVDAARRGLHVFFALFARKMILCGELAGAVAVVGWRIEQPLRTPGRDLLSPRAQRAVTLACASSLILVVVFVAFLRDFWELGARPAFVAYAESCLGGTLALVLVAALWGRWRGHRSPDWVALGMAGSFVLASALGLDSASQVFATPLGSIGGLFGITGPARALHGLATLLSLALIVALSFRVLRVESRPGPLGPVDVFLLCATLATTQGFLAFRSVSAVYILMGGALAAQLFGWRFEGVPTPRPSPEGRGARAWVVRLKVSRTRAGEGLSFAFVVRARSLTLGISPGVGGAAVSSAVGSSTAELSRAAAER